MAYLTFYNPYYLANRDEKNDSAMEQFNNKFNNSCNCVPAANIVENDNEFRIEMALPGVDKSQINMKYENGLLLIKLDKVEENGKEYHHREFNYNGASRVFKTGDKVDVENINARYENGILTINLPKKEAYIKRPAQQIAVA